MSVPAPSQQTETEQLNGLVTEAIELRFRPTLPPPGAGPAEVLGALHETRQALDRVEEILLKVLRFRAGVRRAHAAAKSTHEMAWDEVSSKNRSKSSTDYSSARERYADANLSTLELRRAERQLDARVSHADEAYDAVQMAHRGLNGVRGDCQTMLRGVQFLSSLES